MPITLTEQPVTLTEQAVFWNASKHAVFIGTETNRSFMISCNMKFNLSRDPHEKDHIPKSYPNHGNKPTDILVNYLVKTTNASNKKE